LNGTWEASRGIDATEADVFEFAVAEDDGTAAEDCWALLAVVAAGDKEEEATWLRGPDDASPGLFPLPTLL
jgi:hypothetical protein